MRVLLGLVGLLARAAADWQAGHDADPDSLQSMWAQWTTARPNNGVATQVDGSRDVQRRSWHGEDDTPHGVSWTAYVGGSPFHPPQDQLCEDCSSAELPLPKASLQAIAKARARRLAEISLKSHTARARGHAHRRCKR